MLNLRKESDCSQPIVIKGFSGKPNLLDAIKCKKTLLQWLEEAKKRK